MTDDAARSDAPTETSAREETSARRGKPERRWGRLRILASLLSILIIVAGVVLVRDAAVALGFADGRMWVVEGLEWMDGATRGADWLWPAIVLGALLGLWFLIWALTAPQQNLIAVPGRQGLYVRTSGVEKLAESAADDVPGVDESSAQASTSRVTVRTRTTGSARTKADVTDTVRGALGPLADRYSVRVLTKGLHE
jgi:hypothetical protein